MSFTLDALVEADRRCLDAAELLLDNLDIMPSAAALRRLESEIEKGRSLASEARPTTRLEALFTRHLDASWTVLWTIARQRFEWPRVKVRELLDALAGPGALDRLEARIAAVDQDQILAYLDQRQRFRAQRIPPGAPQARPLLESELEKIAALFRRWLVAREGDLVGLDAAVVLGPADAEKSWYEPARHRVVLRPGEFMVFDRGGRLSVTAVGAYHVLAHELAGHAVQDALSRRLPDPLKPDHRGRLRFASLPVAEGFADHRSSLAVAFAEENASALGVEAEGLDLLRHMVRMGFLHHALPAYVQALSMREREEEGFDAHEHLTGLTGNAGFGEMLAKAAADPIYRLIYNAACLFGLDAVNEAAADLTARGMSEGERIRRLGTGGWALACYRHVVTEATADVAGHPGGVPSR